MAAGFLRKHPLTRFDAAFYEREPSLEVTLTKRFAYALSTTLMYGRRGLKRLLARVAFSNGVVVNIEQIWTLNYMPGDLDLANVDLSQGEHVIGFGSETIRKIIRATYHCRSRAEEDYFLARWIAS